MGSPKIPNPEGVADAAVGVHKLPDSEILRAERVLQVLQETVGPVVYALENAPEDDEPETPEEAAAVAEA